MEKLILVSHGGFSKGLKESTEMILGPQDYLYAVSLNPEDGEEEFISKFNEARKDADSVVVFADLLGGTPCNAVSKLIMQGEDIELYAGMSLPMVITYINGRMIGEKANIIEKSKEYVVHVNEMLASFDEDE
ncbi:PTS sugar transporter subunit IIA [Macrococcoides canis]|uniref:PTS fructose transporter subunit IIA n=1 Tax=Macrococcoides canis TaxID=1855823 RepID=A0A4Y5F762_9STAP|nr:PTS fructose transporter subunit IIA [Macrococcus canis]QAX90290.1 PTS system mannose-specific EIIAB component [Macrococcus canis]QIH77141.1 PTS fructose transporter subunit IIA [Macrococcus canis]QNR06761.1 PTS fructose transporter subunit IIA [Macrococcus canis]